jgi:hypothetical protein
MFPDKGQQSVAYGKSMKLRPAIGSAYGTPAIKKVVWKKEPVKVVGYKSSTESEDVTEDAKSCIKISNGNLSVNKNIERLGYVYYDATVRMETTDGTGLYVEKTYPVVPPTTFMKVNPGLKDLVSGKEGEGDEGYTHIFRNNMLEMNVGDAFVLPLFVSDSGYAYSKTKGGVLIPEITSSNPKTASAYVTSAKIYKEKGENIGLVYECTITSWQKGNATLSIMSVDGSGKKASIKVRVK